MIKILSTIDLPHGWMRMFWVDDEKEAERIAAGRTSYLYQSLIINGLYLFIPCEE